ncbi:MAG: nitrile hydratase accessory protein [Candidatus Tectomicrobia bacterium]|nr:nitrile hydratase accessory protein [Candidatus Tectomicrobia bacterium]
MDDLKNLDAIPSLPRDEEGPVFREPWEAQVFSMTLMLHQQGHFTWKEWTECLGAEITAAQKRGEPDLGDTYYLHWLAALEKIVAKKGLVASDNLLRRKGEWDAAARATPHGQPIVLGGEGREG